MQSVEEKKAHYKAVLVACYSADLLYFLLHILYMILFILAKTYILLYINIASLLLYVSIIYLIKKDKYFMFALVCGNEFLIFTSVATILCGLDSGFLLTLIGICVASYFAAYFSSDKRRKLRNPVTWTIISTVVFLGVYFYSRFNTPYYELESWVSTTLFAIHVVIVFILITLYLSIFLLYAHKLEGKLLNESKIDNLTQTHNRYDLYNYLDSIDDKKDYVLAMIDIDDFKKVNDIYGHIAGDFILKEIVKIAKKTMTNSLIFRYGGEEFIIIKKMYSYYTGAVNELDKFRKNVEERDFNFNGTTLKVTITIGVQRYVEGIKNEAWINAADEKLYKGKNNGKNQTVR